jgi:hypothetical protein
MSPALRVLALGLLLGATATWFALRPSDRATSDSAPIINHQSLIINNWSWRDSDTPPPLPAASVAPSISAWLALRAPDGSPADFATRASALRALLVRLPSAGFSALVDALVRSTRDEDALFLREAFDNWAALDAPAAARWAASRGTASLAFARDAVRLWIAQDPSTAAAFACSVDDETIAASLAGPPLAALAEKDPARALALARSRGESFRISALSGIVETLGRADPAGTVRTYGPELWRGGSGLHMLRGPLTAWVKQDPAAALAWLVSQPRDPIPGASDFDWINSFGNRTPEWRRTVADAFLKTPDQTRRAAALHPILTKWSNEHPKEALAWLDSLSDPDLRLTLLERAAGHYSSGNPAQALPLVLALPEGANRTIQLTHILTAWAQKDAPAALAWIEANDVPGVARAGYDVQGTLLAKIAREEPHTAIAEWAALKDPKAREATLGWVVQSWSEKDPVAAIRWAGEQSKTLGKPLHLDPGVLSRWAAKEPEAALRWIEAWLPAQPKTTADFMAPHYFSALGFNGDTRVPRADTANLYAKIKDPALRSTALTKHLAEWRTKDPAAAENWLKSQTVLLPAEVTALAAP